MLAGLTTTLASGRYEFAAHIDELVLDALCGSKAGSITMLRATCRAARAAATPRLGYVVLSKSSAGDVATLRAAMRSVAVNDEFGASRLGGYPSIARLRCYNTRCIGAVGRSLRSATFASLVSLDFKNCVVLRHDVAWLLGSLRPLLGQIRHLALPRVERELNAAVELEPELERGLSLPQMRAVRSLYAPRGYELSGGGLAELVDVEVASPMRATDVGAVLSSPKLVSASLTGFGRALPEPPPTMMTTITLRYLVLTDVATRTLDALRGLVALEMVCVVGAAIVDCAGAFAHAHTAIVAAGCALRTGVGVVFDRAATPKLRRAQVGAPYGCGTPRGPTRNPVFGMLDVVDATRPYDAQLDALYAARNVRPELDATMFLEAPLDGEHLYGALRALQLPSPGERWVCRSEPERGWLRQTAMYRRWAVHRA